jgi:hypothetical protein
VWQVVEGGGAALVGSAALGLFSKKGRLKTGPQQLSVREGADVALGAATAAAAAASMDDALSPTTGREGGGAAPVPAGGLPAAALAAKSRLGARGEAGQLAHLASLYARGDVPRCGWLDALTSRVGGWAGRQAGGPAGRRAGWWRVAGKRLWAGGVTKAAAGWSADAAPAVPARARSSTPHLGAG